MSEVTKIRERLYTWRTEFGCGTAPSKRQAEKAAESSVLYGKINRAEAAKNTNGVPMPSAVREIIRQMRVKQLVQSTKALTTKV